MYQCGLAGTLNSTSTTVSILGPSSTLGWAHNSGCGTYTLSIVDPLVSLSGMNLIV